MLQKRFVIPNAKLVVRKTALWEGALEFYIDDHVC